VVITVITLLFLSGIKLKFYFPRLHLLYFYITLTSSLFATHGIKVRNILIFLNLNSITFSTEVMNNFMHLDIHIVV
jgi:hypothetical protein